MTVKPVHSGRLRFRITIEQALEVQNEYGEVERTWSMFAIRWSDVQPLRGNERVEADQTNSQVSHKVTVRYLEGITPKMRILFGARVLNIESIINIDGRNRTMELMCREESDDG